MNTQRFYIGFSLLLISVMSCGLTELIAPGANTTSTQVPMEEESGPVSIPGERVPVIFDDDGSPDGTTALLYILSHPNAEVKAATISYGETHPEIYIQHVGRMLDSVGIRTIPLGYGQDGPLAGTNEFPEAVRQFGNEFWGLPLPNADKTYPVQEAPELMVSVINGSPEPLTIFVSGPATNLAQALQLDANIKNNIKAIYMMGGAVYVPGNIDDLQADHPNKVAEWNIFGDPQAAKIAFESGIDFYLVPLDATNLVLINRQDIDQWRQGGAIADFAADIYEMVLNNQGGVNAAIWDLMTAAVMLDDGLCGFQPLSLQVVTQEGNSSGQTALMPGGPANISVCLEPDSNTIRETLIDVFSGFSVLATPAPGEPPGSIQPVTASAEMIDAPARNAIDGNLETIWNSGKDPEQWILINLGAPRSVEKLRLHVSQYPEGQTIHQIWAGGDPNNLTLLHEFEGLTTDGDVLEFVPASPLADIQYVKVVTTQSPSWVAWREIEVIP